VCSLYQDQLQDHEPSLAPSPFIIWGYCIKTRAKFFYRGIKAFFALSLEKPHNNSHEKKDRSGSAKEN
tara:strand:- start:640 stop:843 length:204 start_codon:yes stop_codon:yes gene_type:complete